LPWPDMVVRALTERVEANHLRPHCQVKALCANDGARLDLTLPRPRVNQHRSGTPPKLK
jgi:hypothetical protein